MDFMEAGGIAGRMSNTFTYADTSMVLVTIKSNPTGFIATSISYMEMNASVTTQSLNGATNGSNFAYWTINGVRQASPNGVASSKVSLNISDTTEIVAHYVPSSEDADGDGVMDWLNSTSLEIYPPGRRMIRTGMDFLTSGRASGGRRQPLPSLPRLGELRAECPTLLPTWILR